MEVARVEIGPRDCRQKSFIIENHHHACKGVESKMLQIPSRSGMPVYESMDDERVKRVND